MSVANCRRGKGVRKTGGSRRYRERAEEMKTDMRIMLQGRRGWDTTTTHIGSAGVRDSMKFKKDG